MKKLFVMAAMVLSSVGAFAQQAAGTTTIQPNRANALNFLPFNIYVSKLYLIDY